jgi:hypothetical protein
MLRNRKLTASEREQKLCSAPATSSQDPQATSSFDEQSYCHIIVLMLLAAGSFMLLGSCSAPITIGPDHLGVGLYRTESRDIHPHVDYRKVEGIGVLFTPGRTSLGYAKYEIILAALDKCGYSVHTPLADFAVGKAAEDVGVQFVFPNNPKCMKGEPYD